MKTAINGFGRIGRLVLRAVAESQRTDVEVVAIARIEGVLLAIASARTIHQGISVPTRRGLGAPRGASTRR